MPYSNFINRIYGKECEREDEEEDEGEREDEEEDGGAGEDEEEDGGEEEAKENEAEGGETICLITLPILFRKFPCHTPCPRIYRDRNCYGKQYSGPTRYP